jgi:2-methylisocitrate lyase-like PEP mutase family enzyme
MKRTLHQAGFSEHPGLQLKAEFSAPAPISPFIGVFDLLSATIASRHSFNLFLSGFGFAASHYGLPDLGYISWSEMVDEAWRIRQILPQHKLLVDVDDGYADTGTLCYVTRQLDRMGAAMIMLEDQARPRRCGHYDGKALLRLDDYLHKLNAVLSQRQGIRVLARTDAAGDEIFRRVEAISKTDADVLLVDGVRDLEILRKVSAMTDKPLLFNQIAGGKSPRTTLTELREAGADLVLYSTPCLFAAQSAMDDALTEIFLDDGRLPDTSRGRAVGVQQCTQQLLYNLPAAGISESHATSGSAVVAAGTSDGAAAKAAAA